MVYNALIHLGDNPMTDIRHDIPYIDQVEVRPSHDHRHEDDERPAYLVSDCWKLSRDYEASLLALQSDYEPTPTSISFGPDDAAILAYGHMTWGRFVKLFWAKREKTDSNQSYLDNELKTAWIYGHEVALYEARKRLTECLDGNEKVESSVIQALKLLHSMIETASERQEATSDDDMEEVSDEEVEELLAQLGI